MNEKHVFAFGNFKFFCFRAGIGKEETADSAKSEGRRIGSTQAPYIIYSRLRFLALDRFCPREAATFRSHITDFSLSKKNDPIKYK